MRFSMPRLAGPRTPGPFVQDGPPKGGYAPVNYRRNINPGGLSSVALMGGLTLMSFFGIYKIISANQQRRAFSKEERDIHLAVLPFLTAEADLQGAFIKSKQLENEAELMKDVPNWEAGASVYKTRWMPPMTLPGI